MPRCAVFTTLRTGAFSYGLQNRDDETRAGVRYYFGVFPDGQDLRHVLYISWRSETAISLILGLIDGYPLMILDHIVAQNVRRLESLQGSAF